MTTIEAKKALDRIPAPETPRLDDNEVSAIAGAVYDKYLKEQAGDDDESARDYAHEQAQRVYFYAKKRGLIQDAK